MDQLNLFRRVAHVWIVPYVVQIPAAAYSDNLSIDPAISAGHGVFTTGQSASPLERRADQSNHSTMTVALYDNPRDFKRARNVTYAKSILNVAGSQLNKDESCLNVL